MLMRNELKIEINISQKMLKDLAVLEMNSNELYSYLSEFSNESLFFHLPFEEKIYKEHSTTIDNLEEYLIRQIELMNIGKKEKTICLYFAENLDEKGYLKISFYELSQKYNIEKKILNKALELFKELEPKGIGAKDLREALIFQAKDFPLLKKILINYYQELSTMRFDKIAKKLDVSIDEVKKIIEPMRNFISYPRRDFSGQAQRQLRISDIIISDEFEIKLNKRYNFRLEASCDNKNFKKNRIFKREQKKAEAINESLEKRSTTLMRLAKFIIEYQENFFKGSSMKSLTQEKVAASLGIHISTVSRACRDKILEFKGKQYELKEFFPRKVGKHNSSWEIKKAIKELIDNEDKKNPYSDEDLRKELEKLGIKTARRTIAKYRDNMGIFRWRLRKKYE